ncbi:MAG: hypothetical protein ACI4SO_06735, partial [Muribaculaceae bacterium]
MMTVAGVSNNCAIQIVGNALDSVRKSALYKGAARRKIERARKEIGLYEFKLENSQYKFFDVCDMASETRRLYKANLTTSEYFDFWRATGNAGYTILKNYIYALRHKYYLIECRSRTEKESALRADMAIALIILSLAVKSWESVIEQCVKTYKLPKASFLKLFKDFSLKSVMSQYESALMEVFPDINESNFNDSDKRN